MILRIIKFFVCIIAHISSKYKWNELKPILEREFESIFQSSSQPTYTNSLNDALDAFFKVITIKTPEDCSELKGLADRILPTLYKFYVGAIDRNDKLNYIDYLTKQRDYLTDDSYNYKIQTSTNEIKTI